MQHSVRQVRGQLQTKRMPLFSRKNCKIKVKLRQSLNLYVIRSLFCFKLKLAKIQSHYFYNISEFIKYYPAMKLYLLFSHSSGRSKRHKYPLEAFTSLAGWHGTVRFLWAGEDHSCHFTHSWSYLGQFQILLSSSKNDCSFTGTL